MEVCAVGRRTRRDQRGGWARWLTASGLFHLALLGTLAVLPIFGPATGERLPSSIRVRLLTETRELPVPPPSANPTPSAPGPPPGTWKRQVVSSVSRTRPLPHGDSLANASPQVSAVSPTDTSRVSSPSMEPLSRLGGGPSQPQPGGLPGEGPVQSVLPERGPARPPDESEPSPPASPAEGRTQGILFLQEGSATGRAGPGTLDRGSGNGGAGGTGLGKGIPGGRGGSSEGGVGTDVASRGRGGGSGGGADLAAVLQTIRRRIEEAKTYPEAARRDAVQGTVDLRFRIAPDGSVEVMEILRSSGFSILDEASKQTIRRAAPYPPVAGWIRLPLSYRLDR